MEQTLDQKSVQTPAPKRPESAGISPKLKIKLMFGCFVPSPLAS